MTKEEQFKFYLQAYVLASVKQQIATSAANGDTDALLAMAMGSYHAMTSTEPLGFNTFINTINVKI